MVREPAGFQHGTVAARLAKLIMDHADRHDLGRVVAAKTGFTIATDPDTVRAPDVGFVRKGRVPSPAPRGFATFAPAPWSRCCLRMTGWARCLAKVADWLSAGVTPVWVVDPLRRSARVYRADGSETIVDGSGSLDGGEVLPGLAFRLEQVLQ